MPPSNVYSSVIKDVLLRLNTLPHQEAHRRPRRFFEPTPPPTKSPEPPTVPLVAHHGVPNHPHHPPKRTTTTILPQSGICPALLSDHRTIDYSSVPTGLSSESKSIFDYPSGPPTPAKSTPTTINPTMLDDLFVSSSFDWDQFLVKDADADASVHDIDNSPASAVLALQSQVNTPASDVNGCSPKSTDSEQSQALDVSGSLGLLDFDFDLAAAGIAHDPSDVISSNHGLPDVTLSADPTMMSTFGHTLGDFGNLAALSNDAVTQLQLGNILNQLSAPAVPAVPSAPGLAEAYAALGWPLSKVAAASTPAPESPAPSMKRKASDMSDDLSVKRPRGRPPSVTPGAKRPYRRQSKNGLSLSQLAAAAASGSPVVTLDEKKPIVVEDDDDEDETPAPVRLTSTGKPSTARPKAVVPEKYMKNGEAQAITGMDTETIMSFPNWSSLMECVDEEHRAGAEIFGQMISENRDKAKWAAKKSRDERKAKVESLEGQVDELQSKLNEMRGVLLGLVGRGAVSLSEVEAYI